MKLSLRDLGEQVGLSSSFLSQLENDTVSPSLESLRKISKALDVPLFHFLLDEKSENLVVRGNNRLRLVLPASNISYELLTPDLNRQMELFIGEFEPGDSFDTVAPRQYAEECIYILQGQLEVQVDDDVYLLGPGDSIYFECLRLRHFATKGDQTVRFIAAITPAVF